VIAVRHRVDGFDLDWRVRDRLPGVAARRRERSHALRRHDRIPRIGRLNTTGGSTAYSTSISVPACAA
jgi:hypothetical protein